MFEKEAEEYANKGLAEKYKSLEWYSRKNDFQKGAEFGYSKCFSQIQKIVNEHTRLDCIIPELLRLKENNDDSTKAL